MTVKTETTCDNTNCGCLIGNYSTNYKVYENKRFKTEPGDNGPWDFCSLACLESWAVQR